MCYWCLSKKFELQKCVVIEHQNKPPGEGQQESFIYNRWLANLTIKRFLMIRPQTERKSVLVFKYLFLNITAGRNSTNQ